MDDFTRVCHECIGDPFLADEVKKDGVRALCGYCGGTGVTVLLEDLANRIHEVLQEHFELTPSYPDGYEYVVLARQGLWERSGYFVADVVSDIAGLSIRLAEHVTELLSNRHGYSAMKNGEENPYESDAMYEERSPDDLNFWESWEGFRSEILSRARYFSTFAEEALNSIFGDLTTHRTIGNKPVIREVGPDDDDRIIWRARKAHSKQELKTILKAPAREIGPPPSRLAKGGRMNAHGIPVFYGALDEATCVAEARAPVGSYVVVAQYELLRRVRLLDFGALMEVYVEGSHFDPAYSLREGRAMFLRRLVREISKPVMPQDEVYEYLATQAVAEFLANKVEPRLDGIVFMSSQTGGVGRNVVLFNHACGVAPAEPPDGTDVSVSFGFSHEVEEEEENGEITVFETIPDDPETDKSVSETQKSTFDLIDAFPSEHLWDKDPYKGGEEQYYHDEPVLSLDPDSVVVLDIKSVKYRWNRRNVFRFRSTKGEESEF